jgi:hypothetical protein
MPKFSNGRVTSRATFYNRGVPSYVTNFGILTTLNYSQLRTISRNNIQKKRPLYSFILLFK